MTSNSQKEKVPWIFTFFRAGFRAGFRARFRVQFYAKLELFRASRRFSLLKTRCTRRYEKRTQQAELVGKTFKKMVCVPFRRPREFAMNTKVNKNITIARNGSGKIVQIL